MREDSYTYHRGVIMDPAAHQGGGKNYDAAARNSWKNHNSVTWMPPRNWNGRSMSSPIMEELAFILVWRTTVAFGL